MDPLQRRGLRIPCSQVLTVRSKRSASSGSTFAFWFKRFGVVGDTYHAEYVGSIPITRSIFQQPFVTCL
jgi:hypothetical protein